MHSSSSRTCSACTLKEGASIEELGSTLLAKRHEELEKHIVNPTCQTPHSIPPFPSCHLADNPESSLPTPGQPTIRFSACVYDVARRTSAEVLPTAPFPTAQRLQIQDIPHQSVSLHVSAHTHTSTYQRARDHVIGL